MGWGGKSDVSLLLVMFHSREVSAWSEDSSPSEILKQIR